MRINLLLFLIFSGAILSGCAKYAETDQGGAVKRTFGITLSDSPITIQDKYQPLRQSALDFGSNNHLTIDSSKWLDLSDELLQAGEAMAPAKGQPLLQLGHKLSSDFYGLSYSHTSMTGTVNPPGSPYAEAAYYYAQPLIVTKLNETVGAVEGKITQAANRVSVPLNDLGANPLPEVVLQRMVTGLNDFKNNLYNLRNGTGDSFIDQINSTLDSKYISDLQDLENSAVMGGGKALAQSMADLEQSLLKMSEIDDGDKQRLLTEVRLGKSLAQQNQKVSNSSQALQVLVNFWLSKDFRNDYPDSVKSIFKNLSDNDILTLATGNQGTLLNPQDWQNLQKRTDYSLMSNLELIALTTQNRATLSSDDRWKTLKPKFDQLNKVLNQKDVEALASRLANAEPISDDDRRETLISCWLGLSQRLSFPSILKDVFSTLSDPDLETLGSDSTLWLLAASNLRLAIIRHKILDAIEAYGIKPGDKSSAAIGVSNFKKLFDDSIIAATRARLDNAIVPIARTLSATLRNTLIPALEDQKRTAEATADGTYKIYGRYYLGKLIFGADELRLGTLNNDSEKSDNDILQKYPAPLLEKDKLNFSKVDGRITNQASSNDTSARVLGLGLSNTFHRLLTLKNFENVNDDDRGALVLSYQALCKMLALSGYRGFDSNLVESLAVPMTAGHSGELLDIRNYQPDKVVFATPDDVKIKGQFKLDRASENQASVSVNGQMELLRGYSNMLKYFKPWNTSSFDAGLGALHIEEDSSLQAFDKNDYFLLSLGLSTIVLKNISAKMLGIITENGTFVEAFTVADPTSLPAAAAVLGDYNISKMNHQISTESTARAIIAISEFFEQIKDLEKTQNPTILPQISGSQLADSRDSLRRLLSGLMVFSTDRLMETDGGFVTSYDADKLEKSKGPRKLKDQILMEQALLRAGTVLDSDFILSRAVDNFFFLNGHFWNGALGFYRSTEDDSSGKVRLVDVARSLENLQSIRQYLSVFLTQSPNIQSSILQAQQLEQLWLNRFFNTDALNKPSISQVMDFSL